MLLVRLACLIFFLEVLLDGSGTVRLGEYTITPKSYSNKSGVNEMDAPSTQCSVSPEY
jgi:hypothetical protein